MALSARESLLVSHFAGYGSYHNNMINKIIHIICVPLIVWSLMMLLRLIPFTFVIESAPRFFSHWAATPGWEPHWAFFFSVILLIYYYVLDFGVGFVSSCLFALMYYTSNLVFNACGSLACILTVALVVHIVSWVFQFIGHGVFEKRRPALIDNIFQVFVAPFFVTLEVMFLFGYKKEVHQACEQQINKNIAAMNTASSSISLVTQQ
eukprot:GILI01017568.1.p1 GENE.GILI01017568.1~~GILI01017568.1.p1  ORF type:complete len:207 (-),score=38.38 GILI01017568.1:115-735(-)